MHQYWSNAISAIALYVNVSFFTLIYKSANRAVIAFFGRQLVFKILEHLPNLTNSVDVLKF